MNHKNTRNLLLAIGLTVLLLYSFYTNAKYRSEIEKLQSDFNDQLLQYQDLQNRFDHYVQQQESKDMTCEMTRTFRLVSFLENYDVDPDYIYVVMDQFQSFHPFVMKIPVRFHELLFINQYYEFDLLGKNSDDITNMVVKDIRATEKEGMDQIQESCIVQ